MEEAKKLTGGMRVFSDGSCIDGMVGAAAVLFRQGTEAGILRKNMGAECWHTVYEAEVVGLTLAAELLKRERFVEATTIGADSQAAIRAMSNTRGKPGQHLVDQLHKKVEEVHSRHGSNVVEIWWIPGHEGIRENERADEEAKRAARGDSSPADLLPHTCSRTIPTSRSAARQSHPKKIKGDAASMFIESL